MSRKRPRHITITDQSHGLPYSKGLMASSLLTSGLPQTEAFRIAERIEESLKQEGCYELTSRRLRDLAASMLSELSEEYANTYLKWQAVEELEVPLIILLGGATGVGKSTIATQLAARLGITRVISTDAIREVLRAAFSPSLMPTLYASSFTADTALRVPLRASTDPVIVGFQEQVTAVSVGIKALIARALEEATDIIVEGAHVVPGFLEGWEEEFKEAVLVPIVITVSHRDLHRSHFHMRAMETRPTERYLSAFDKIRNIQSHITELAVRHGVPVVDSFDLDSTLQEIVSIVLAKALESAQVRAEIKAAPGSVKEPSPDEPLESDGIVKKSPAGKKTSLKQKSRLKSWQVIGTRRKAQ